MLLMLSTFSTDLASSTQKGEAHHKQVLNGQTATIAGLKHLIFFTFPPSRQSKMSCRNECEHRRHSI